ncbi:acetyltransferase [Paucilactobacillus hokkaidonensis JCM 18461]|uniref:Acetyltransferase n=2 Tax=Paucilactobacillus hokkaidonensis TaxID=1193095 RepID=A0A0A1GWC2_9LACO|nr:Vat family streptogramin A O-acetyltransferase [Paucilactobacillus hokkaidonensis]KRO09470.1 streptogramin A resistance protein [Paucilactobacillus hokkaidonensis]BAP84646.1 acetyltransferase [Paucilactobacillus hokkaidonensis JCM 18461]
MTFGPDPHQVYPNSNIKELVFIKNTITRPNIKIGDFTYYDDPVNPEGFEEHVTHHYEFLGDQLIIGKFCSIASGIEFIMNGANHVMKGISTYPFNILANGWENKTPELSDLPFKGNTVVGNDVWFGQNVTVLPGITIGDGAIIGANSVVTKDVAPYNIVGGNPAQMIKQRFSTNVIASLEKLAWWDRDISWINAHIGALMVGEISLEQIEALIAAK